MAKPLTEVESGTKVKVVDIVSGRGATTMLREVGIVPGTELEVVKTGPGPVIVRIGGATFSLGRGLAAKVLVEKVE